MLFVITVHLVSENENVMKESMTRDPDSSKRSDQAAPLGVRVTSHTPWNYFHE